MGAGKSSLRAYCTLLSQRLVVDNESPVCEVFRGFPWTLKVSYIVYCAWLKGCPRLRGVGPSAGAAWNGMNPLSGFGTAGTCYLDTEKVRYQ
jgi:hypothetical protein